MFEQTNYTGNKEENYELLLQQLQALSADVEDPTSILANASALLNQFLSEINWVGFYIYKIDKLILGPFQGLPACIYIPIGKGVCGTAAKERKTMRVTDVLEFPGHIACDGATRSEIVIPIIIDDVVYGVLDIDSPIINRFDEIDEVFLEKFVQVLEHILGQLSSKK